MSSSAVLPLKYYLTTAIDYVNAAPHVGHAYEKIAADVLARFYRMQGVPVFFLTGTDEHGTKVEKTAEGLGIPAKAYADQTAEQFKQAWRLLNLSYDRFIRTTDEDHYEEVQYLWGLLAQKGDLYKQAYTGLYCTGCETFLTARDLNADGACVIHQRLPESVEEENYFFKLSNYREALIEHIQANPGFIQPAFRRQEVLKMLEELQDISVSRPRTSVNWGIPVPGDDTQVIYVWIDALSNYLTGIGYRQKNAQEEALFNQFWPADLHLIGKDILRFHAIYWPAMLLSADLPLPRTIFAHGFINLNDTKISKSLGNVVSPQALMERFALPHADPIRYYLMTVAQFGQDGNFTEEDFKLKVNADLANNLGNLLNRTLSMTVKYFEGRVPQHAQNADTGCQDISWIRRVQGHYQALAFQNAVAEVLGQVDAANALINQKEPWNLFKNGQLAELSAVFYQLLETLRQVAIAIFPVTPTLSAHMWQQLGYTESIEGVRWADLTEKPIAVGQTVQPAGPILPRLDSELAGAAGKKST